MMPAVEIKEEASYVHAALLCVRCWPTRADAHYTYRGHSICSGCISEVSGRERKAGGGAWDFTFSIDADRKKTVNHPAARPEPTKEQYEEAREYINAIEGGEMDVVLFLASVLAERDVRSNAMIECLRAAETALIVREQERVDVVLGMIRKLNINRMDEKL